MKQIELNLNRIDEKEFYDRLGSVFGFPDNFGRNMDAAYDCLTTLRDEEDMMTTVKLGKEESIILKIKDIERGGFDVVIRLLSIIESTNDFHIACGEKPAILIEL